MAYDIDLQTNYPSTPYNWKGGSGKYIYGSGCCPSTWRNISRNLLGTKVTIKEVCALAIECGARVNGGTLPGVLLKAAKERWGGFTYEYTTSDSKARAHAAAGGMCMCHTTGTNKVFSTSGHFVAILAATASRVTIADPYITANKWNSYGRASVVNTNTGMKGVVTVSPATSDASFDYYYLISKEEDTQAKTTQEVDDMTVDEVKAIIAQEVQAQAAKAVSDFAKDAWTAAHMQGIMDGTMPQAPVAREQLATVLARLGLIGKDVDAEPADWAKSAWEAAAAQGVLDDTNPKGVVTREMLARVLQNLKLI